MSLYKRKKLILKEDQILELLEARIKYLEDMKKENSLPELTKVIIQKETKTLFYLLNKSWITGLYKRIKKEQILNLTKETKNAKANNAKK